jgi:transcriptional regulator with XRE-family HTH domain
MGILFVDPIAPWGHHTLMNLTKYLEKYNISAGEFADIIGVNRSNVSRFCSGQRLPGLKTLERIYIATRGKVTAKDFFTGRSGEQE